MEQIPTSDLEILKFPFQYAITNPRKTYFLQQQCEVVQNINICKENALLDYSEDSCFHNLLHGIPAECNYQEYPNKTEVKQILPQQIIVKNAPALEIFTTCGIQHKTIKRTCIIEFRNCSIEIGNAIYEDYQIVTTTPTFLLPLLNLEINRTSIKKFIDLEKLDESYIKNRKIIEEEKYNHTVNFSVTYSLFIILSITITAYCIYNKLKYNPQPNSTQLTTSTIVLPQLLIPPIDPRPNNNDNNILQDDSPQSRTITERMLTPHASV